MGEFPAAAVDDIERITDISVSGDGATIAYVVDNRSLFVIPADGSEEPHRLGVVPGMGTVKWSPDGSKLGVLMAKTPQGEGSDDADHGAKRQVWAFDVARGGDAHRLTDRPEGVREFDWHPDGHRLVVSARDPTADEREYLDQRRNGGPIVTERLQIKADKTGYFDVRDVYLFVVDVETGEERRLDDAHSDRFEMPWPCWSGMEPTWHPDGDRIAYLAPHGEDTDLSYVEDIYTISPDGSDRRQLTDGDLFRYGLAWSPSGDRLAFAGQDAWNWYAPTEAYVLEPGDDAESVSAPLDRTLSWPWHGMPTWVDEETMVALAGDEGRTRFVRLHVDDGPERVFEVQADTEAIPEYDVAGNTVACVVTRPTDGRDLYAFDLADLDATATDPRVRLTTANADLLDASEFPACHRFSFDSDDATVDGLLYHPDDFDPDDPDPRPTILSIHGGPMGWDEPQFHHEQAYWASRGYLFLKVNYRGSRTYGRDFCEALRTNQGTIEIDDQLAAVDAAVDHGWADPDRLFCTGASYGGYSTAMQFVRSDRFVAGAADNGVYDQRASYGVSDNSVATETTLGFPWENPEKFDESSPITDVDEIETPLLITAGSEDWRCPVTQSERLYYSLKRLGVPTRLVIYPGEHHGPEAPGNANPAIHRLEQKRAWFESFDPAVTETTRDPNGDGSKGGGPLPR